MWSRLKQRWRELKAGKPGRRFQSFHRERQKTRRSSAWKPVVMGIGALLVIAGIIQLAIPGPGLLFIFVGVALFAEESLVVARTLDWIELRVRRLWKRAAPGS